MAGYTIKKMNGCSIGILCKRVATLAVIDV